MLTLEFLSRTLPAARTEHIAGILACNLLFCAACGDDGTPRSAPERDAGDHLDLDASHGSSPDAATDAGTDAAVVLSESSFLSQLAAAYCATIEPCCAHGAAGCVDNMTLELTQAAATAKGAGNVFVPARAAECLTAVESLSAVECSPGFQSNEATLGACSGAFDGTVAPGEVCTDVAQCERGTKNGTLHAGFVGCGSADGADPKRCRAFEPTTDVGAPCEHGFEGDAARVNVCVEGNSWCREGTCQPPPACDAAHPNGLCDEDAICIAGVCEPRGQDAADCSVIPCARGYSCNAAQTCEPVPTPSLPWGLTIGFWGTQYECPG